MLMYITRTIDGLHSDNYAYKKNIYLAKYLLKHVEFLVDRFHVKGHTNKNFELKRLPTVFCVRGECLSGMDVHVTIQTAWVCRSDFWCSVNFSSSMWLVIKDINDVTM